MKGLLSKAFLFWVSASREFDKIKQDPQKSEKSVRFGVRSLILSIVGMIVTVGFSYLAYVCFNSASANGLSGILIVIGGALCVLIAIVCLVEMVLASLLYAIYQRKLNKRKIGLAALIVSLVLIALTVAGVVIVLFVIAGS